MEPKRDLLSTVLYIISLDYSLFPTIAVLINSNPGLHLTSYGVCPLFLMLESIKDLLEVIMTIIDTNHGVKTTKNAHHTTEAVTIES